MRQSDAAIPVDGEVSSEAHNQDAGALVPAVVTGADSDWGEDAQPQDGRTWRQEVPRWLATLDTPSTRREYEKAVRYFFETVGVPQALDELTYDLLLAYRGSLARRAERGPRPTAAPGVAHTAPKLPPHSVADALPGAGASGSDGETAQEIGEDEDRAHARAGASRTGPLAPATANLRITALRRFLLHCVLWDLLPHLSTDRIAAALRRLRIERRRPYQVLAEPEWDAFLTAARRPASEAAAPEEQVSSAALQPLGANAAPSPEGTSARSPWGIPRALRQREDGGSSETRPAFTGVATARDRRTEVEHVRSRAGLTGARTAVRDHALLALALATGLRAIELCGLDVGDLRREWHGGREEWWLILPDVKTKGQRGGRTLPLGAELARTVLTYVAGSGRNWERQLDHASPLFLSNRKHNGAEVGDRRLSTPQVRRIVDRVEAQWAAAGGVGEGGKGVGAQTGLGRAISPHALRHSTAVALLEGNEVTGRPPASVEHVRGWLGHFDIRTTQGYLEHVDSRRHRRPFALDPVQPSDSKGVGSSAGLESAEE